MKQVLQRLDSGAISILDVPRPAAGGPRVVVRARASLISAGTERMLIEFGRASLLDKVRSQPDRVREVLAKVKTDGLMTTMDAVRSKLSTPTGLGYCNAGVITEIGPDVTKLKVGDRVVTNGAHAEYVTVSQTLAARIPDNVSFEAAAFTPIAAIGLQGIRLANPTLGETVVVYGLGLIGLLCVQMLRANGCRVIGIDRNADRLAIAERFGAQVVNGVEGSAVSRVMALTDGIGADAVLLTLASDSNEPMREASAMSRKRGRLVLVGVTGLNLAREDFYKKELTFQVSCSYGPGRHDAQYEDQGIDYPVGFVRWTEQRNFDAVLELMASGMVDPLPLITHRFDIDNASDAYTVVSTDITSIGILLQYPGDDLGQDASSRTVERVSAPGAGKPTVAVIGAGNFALRVLIPMLAASGARLRTIASGAGTTGAIAGDKFGFERVTTDLDEIWSDPAVDTVFLLTRHDSHASLARKALEAGKNVFVEKPLALNEAELDAVEAAARKTGARVMVGFNRRFAPFAKQARQLVAGRGGPMSIVMTVNSGVIPRDSWVQSATIGGGRITGEGCHFIDLARYLVGSAIVDVQVRAAQAAGTAVDDVAAITLGFADGSIAAIQYYANGPKSYPKERVECFFDGRTVQIDNWRRLRKFEVTDALLGRSWKQDKGHEAEVAAWVDAVKRGVESPIPLDELIEVSRWSIRAGDLARGVQASEGVR
jgi:predicted dehydrogenase/NADPH:quinone reductase-like Zn-dependent oxidoreductase